MVLLLGFGYVDSDKIARLSFYLVNA